MLTAVATKSLKLYFLCNHLMLVDVNYDDSVTISRCPNLVQCGLESECGTEKKQLTFAYTRILGTPPISNPGSTPGLLTSHSYSTHCLAVPHGIQLLPIIPKTQTRGQLHTTRQSKMTYKLLKKEIDSADPPVMFIPFRPKTIKTTLMTRATASKVTPNPIRIWLDRVSLAAPYWEKNMMTI